ncbi:MAG: hypothetical protein DRQ55_02735 [Planctomycetota bacterium]|nr:MAG: hypothetical protein DRQ55_02735 [Planctomycetota bacterium]
MRKHHDATRELKSLGSRRGEHGWVLIATLILTSVVASITVGWARHAVLSKGQLEYGSGASRTEEASRSGFARTREKMRKGNPPGAEEDGEEDHAFTEHGDEVIASRNNKSGKNDRRDVRVRVEHESGSDHRDAAIRGEAEIVPGSKGGGKRTCMRKTEGDKVLLVPGLTMITGEMVFTPSSNLEGVFLMEAGSRIVLEDCTLDGVIVTRSALDPDAALATGSDRPEIEILGGFNCRPGSDFPGLSICGPDVLVNCDSGARIDIDGMIVAEDLIVPCRGVLRGMVVTEVDEQIGSLVERPGHGRGVKSFPEYMEVGSERMTRIAFPALEFSEDEYDAMEAYDVLSDL